VVVVRVDAEHLVGERLRGERVEEHARAVASSSDSSRSPSSAVSAVIRKAPSSRSTSTASSLISSIVRVYGLCAS